MRPSASPLFFGAREDLRYVLRQMRKSPGFVCVALATIGLGIALNTTAFTLYDAVVLKPLAVRDPASMVRVLQANEVANRDELPYAAYEVLGRARSLNGVVASSAPQVFTATLPGRAVDDFRVASGQIVSASYFTALGVRLIAGRAFDGADDHAAVVSYDFWTRALGSDKGVLGKSVTVNGVSLAIVGIAPPDFAGTGLPAAVPDLWVPLGLQSLLVPGGDWRYDPHAHWQILARLASGASLEQARQELDALSVSVLDTLAKPIPLSAKHATFFQADAGEFEVFQQASVIFMVALALILGIAAVNLVNLLAARNAAREREVTLRLALGASRARIARQLASESLILGGAGGVIGLALSFWLARAARDWLAATLPAVTGNTVFLFLDLSLDWRIVSYALALALIVGSAVGLWPAVRATRVDINGVLKQGGTATAGRAAWTSRNMLLATQVAASLVLLVAAGLLLGGIRGSRAVDTGFDSDHMLVLYVDPGSAPGAVRTLRLQEVARRLQELPQVRAVAWSHRIPFLGTHLSSRAGDFQGPRTISINAASTPFFTTMGMPIVAGRGFTESEVQSGAPVLVISESLARAEWPGQNPIGKSVEPRTFLADGDTVRAYTVIGVTKDVRSNFLSRVDAPTEYFPHDIDGTRGVLLIRTAGNPVSVVRSVLATLARISPTLPPHAHIETMTGGPMAIQRLMAQAPATVALALALIGLALASIGVYGLISQIVARRTREIGVHMALGASPVQVVVMVMRKTLRPVAWGAGAGLVGASAVSLFLRHMIATPDLPDFTYGAGAFNPFVFAGVLAALAVVVVAACGVPASRAAGVDATVALRAE